MNINRKIIEAARDCSLHSNMKYKLGSAIYDDDGKIYSTGFNFCYGKSLTAKLSNRFLHIGTTKWSVHAESAALIHFIKKYKSHPKNMNMYVFRGNKNGEPLLARPCSACAEVLRSVGMTVEYSK